MPEQVDIPALVERVRELDKAATKGPWFSVNVAGNPVLCTGENYTDCAVLGGLNDGDCDEQQAKRNGELAALYRTAAPVLADEVERLTALVKQLELSISGAWYTNRLAWSPTLGTQVYEFTCKTCGQVEERPSHKGYDPPMGCYRCHRNKQEQEAR